MKQWYTFYSSNSDTPILISDMERLLDTDSIKPNQLGSYIHESKLNQPGSELSFPVIFSFVPWKHHVLIIQKSKSIEEALFYR